MKLPLACLVLGAVLTAPWVESPDFPREQQEKAYRATLRLRTPGNDLGTAVRVAWFKDTKKAFYVTAAHVVGNEESVDLEWFDPKNGDVAGTVEGAKVIKTWPEVDLALMLAIEPVEPSVIPICPAAKAPAKAPFAVLSLGCQLGSPDIWLDQVQAEVKVNRAGLRPNMLCWQVGKESIIGRSGGPLVERNGHLVGICSGIAKGKTYYIHVKELEECLKKAHLTDLIPK
jgi:hypothetical protein